MSWLSSAVAALGIWLLFALAFVWIVGA